MKFEIDFNWENNDELLEKLGVKRECFEEYTAYFIELESFKDLENILLKLDKLTNDMYSAVITFDNPTIYLDNKV